jgi:hypothetical protein
VTENIVDGRRIVERFVVDGNPVQTAFWAKESDEGLWYLYISTDLTDLRGALETYRAVHASLAQLDELSLSSSDIKVIGPRSSLAKKVAAFLSRHPTRSATRIPGERLGTPEFDQVYIYPETYFQLTNKNQMTTEEITREVLRLMNRGTGGILPSRVTLKDGTSFEGVPFSLQVGTQSSIMVQFIDPRNTAPRVYQADEISSIS